VSGDGASAPVLVIITPSTVRCSAALLKWPSRCGAMKQNMYERLEILVNAENVGTILVLCCDAA